MKLWEYVVSALAAISLAVLLANGYEYLERIKIEKEATEIVSEFFSGCKEPLDVDCELFQAPMGIKNWQCQLQCGNKKVSLAKYPSGWIKRQ